MTEIFLVVLSGLSIIAGAASYVSKKDIEARLIATQVKLKETEALYFFTRWMSERAKYEDIEKDESKGLRVTENGIEFE